MILLFFAGVLGVTILGYLSNGDPFTLESLGYSTPDIRIRVAEMASYFGIQDWFYKNVAELSGGQKQLLNLASLTKQIFSILGKIQGKFTGENPCFCTIDFSSMLRYNHYNDITQLNCAK